MLDFSFIYPLARYDRLLYGRNALCRRWHWLVAIEQTTATSTESSYQDWRFDHCLIFAITTVGVLDDWFHLRMVRLP